MFCQYLNRKLRQFNLKTLFKERCWLIQANRKLMGKPHSSKLWACRNNFCKSGKKELCSNKMVTFTWISTNRCLIAPKLILLSSQLICKFHSVLRIQTCRCSKSIHRIANKYHSNSLMQTFSQSSNNKCFVTTQQFLPKVLRKSNEV